jgi:hypothetical protein
MHQVFHPAIVAVEATRIFCDDGFVPKTAEDVVLMTTEGHIAALERRHRELDKQIEQEQQSISHDDLLITSLKRKKLEVKDELAKMRADVAA